jgi:amidase
MKEIAFSSASHLAALTRQRELGCLELMDYFIARIEKLDGKLNAVIVRDFEQARLEARRLDNTAITGPLHGVPMTIKEGIDVARLPTSFGIPHFAGNIAKIDSVARLKTAGAVIFGKTNVPAGLADWQTYNEVYGSTGNPWHLSHSPGGLLRRCRCGRGSRINRYGYRQRYRWLATRARSFLRHFLP